jgi:hypothetical protein
MNDTLKLLHKRLQEAADMRARALASGNSKDFAEYKNACGVIQGLQIAQREIEDLAKKVNHDDD